MGTLKFVQVAQRVEDLDRAAAFYSGLLDAAPKAVFEVPGLVFFDVGGVRLLLEKSAPSSLLYFDVGDVQQAVETLRARGTRVIAEPHVIFVHEDDRLGPAGSEEWMAFVEDTEGNSVGLVSRIQTSGD